MFRGGSVLFAADTRPAGGAAIGEVILASGIGLGLTAALLGLVFVHRTRRSAVLTRIGTRLGSATGVPPWVALPTILTTLSLLVALLGMLWDISLHIGVGRDEGPLANPAHFLILFGLFGVFAGGVLACCWTRSPVPPPSTSCAAGTSRSGASCSPRRASTPCSASPWTTSGTGCSGRTSRSGAPPT
jgi:hypothetical protein